MLLLLDLLRERDVKLNLKSKSMFLSNRGLFEDEAGEDDDTDMFAGISSAGNNDTGK